MGWSTRGSSLILRIPALETVFYPTVLSQPHHPPTPRCIRPPLALAEPKVQGQFPPSAVMPPCLWLIWVSGLTELSLKEWALVVTYEEDAEAFGTLYKVRSTTATSHRFPHPQTPSLPHQLKDVGTGLSKYIPDIIRGVRYQDHFGHRYWEGRMLLGQITETVVELLPLYCEVGADLINSQNQGRGLLAGENGSQEWVLHIVSSFEDSKILPKGSTDRAGGCPRRYIQRQ